MTPIVLCNEPTPSGKPCNMPKGHPAEFHRYREYRKPISWTIEVDGKTEDGLGRQELGYAITASLKKSNKITIHIEATPDTRA